ncbi:MAG: DUF484 family protein [Gammaproteobacteria bacterium]|nr:DUF484 family protein [Gammaproteobacteria bacterium]
MPSPQDVKTFLEQHPDFLVEHPDLLETLQVPHGLDGPAVSLVERQVQVLRDRQAESRQRLAELVRNARDNEALVGRVHALALRLLHARDAAGVAAQAEASMHEDFDVRPARLLAAADIPPAVRALVASGKPRCGQLREDDRNALLGDAAAGIASMALVPIGADCRYGLLALGSTDAARFHPGMGTVFLERIGELVAAALGRA